MVTKIHTNNKNTELFFQPLVGNEYWKGFHGTRILVVGTANVCLENCEHKSLCINQKLIKEMDMRCPFHNEKAHSEKDKSLYLHNNNIVEMTAYIEDEADYPTFSAFTLYMLNRKDSLTPSDKQSFWNSVAFVNLLQRFSDSKIMPPYAKNSEEYDSAVASLKPLLEKLKPQLIYVWGKEAATAIENNLGKIQGLKRESIVREHSTINLSLFSYNYIQEKVSEEYIALYLSNRLHSKIERSEEGKKRKVVGIEKAILNAIDLGILYFNNGELVISLRNPEQVAMCLLDNIRHYYTLNSWNDIENIFKKYNRNGIKVACLRKLRRFSPRDATSTSRENDIFKKILCNKR